MNDQTARRFLNQHGMDADAYTLEQLTALWLSDMQRGLRGAPSGMHMLPAFVPADTALPDDQPVLVMDAGGTNLRAALVRLTQGGIETLFFEKTPMPGSHGELTAEEFFSALAERLLPVADRASRACLSFSYPCRITPDGDGRLIALCKEVRVSGAAGEPVCARIEQALRRLGASGHRRWRLINDATAAMLGAAATAHGAPHGGCVGFIIGTGVNLCYGEPCENIEKSPEAMAFGGTMVINTESGCFGGLPQGDVDRLLDARSAVPNDHLAEKMISGGYLPELLRLTLLQAADEGLLTADAAPEALTMADFDALLTGRTPEALAHCAPIGLCAALADGILERAAKFAASMLLAVSRRAQNAAGLPLRVCMEGTTVLRTPTYLDRIRRFLAEGGTAPELVRIDDVTLIGSAMAAQLP